MQPGLVVVVEDDPAIADVQRRYLSAAGFGVHTERDGRAGLDAIRRLRPVAVVLDVGLPSLDGVEICRALRAEGDWTPVLFVTARDDEVDRVLGLELVGATVCTGAGAAVWADASGTATMPATASTAAARPSFVVVFMDVSSLRCRRESGTP